MKRMGRWLLLGVVTLVILLLLAITLTIGSAVPRTESPAAHPTYFRANAPAFGAWPLHRHRFEWLLLLPYAA